jgi:heat shock protein HslJ
MRQMMGFLFFMLFLGGFALVTLKNMKAADTAKQDASSGQEVLTIVSGRWHDETAIATDGQETFVQFQADGRLIGYAGCNRFFGQYVATDSTIEVGPLGATRMACAPELMDREMAFLQMIESATEYTLANGSISLRNPQGDRKVLQFIHLEQDE